MRLPVISSPRFELTSAQLTGGQWVGPAVRAQNSGQNGYVGFYYWNNGSPELMLYKIVSGSFTQLGSTYNSGALARDPAGARGGRLHDLVPAERQPVVSASDSSITGGAPGSWPTAPPRLAAGPAGTSRVTRSGALFRGFPGPWCCRITAVTISASAANGSFTFATALAAGAAYSVTVKTNPSGQSCTVSSGSGTVGSAERHQCRGLLQRWFNGDERSDNFNRADGGLGANWTAISDGGMAISSRRVIGTAGRDHR